MATAPPSPTGTSHVIGVFFDVENLAISAREAKLPRFDPELVLQRLLEKGRIVVKRAYADWRSLGPAKRHCHEAGVELIDLPGSKASGKNSADIKMVVDALEVCFTKDHVDAFALITGDSDFSPLVSKLREFGKVIIGVGVKANTSRLLVDNCDEFIYYDDLVRKQKSKGGSAKKVAGGSAKEREAFAHLLDAAEALTREGKVLYPSLLKETIKRKKPQFDEEYHGFSSFTKLLHKAQDAGLVTLEKDEASGNWVVTEFVAG